MMTDRRLRLLTLLAVLLFGAAWARAAELTTVGSGEIKAKLGEGRQPQIVAAPRGTVTDRKGYALAISEPASDVAVTPYMIDDPRPWPLASRRCWASTPPSSRPSSRAGGSTR